MIKFFGKKDESRGTGVLAGQYQKLLDVHSNNINAIEQKADVYFDKDNYADPMEWMDALALCDVALTNNKVTDIVLKLYHQIYGRSWNKHSSMRFDAADYDFWFKLCENINNRFIEMGHTCAYVEQADLYVTSRKGYRDYSKAKDCFQKGMDAGDAVAFGDYGYGMYYGMPGYGEANEEEGLRLIEKSKEMGYDLADLLLLHIEFSRNEDNDSLLEYIQNYMSKASDKRKAHYILSDYYTKKVNDPEKAIEAMKKGCELNEHYCQYLYGMAILNNRVEGVDKKEGIRLLEEAYDYYIVYAGNFLGQYYYYANDENTSVEKAIEWHEKSVLYYNYGSIYELAIIYLYNDKARDHEKAMFYLDMAIAEGNPKAMSEKAYLLIEYFEPEKQDPQEAKRLFEQAMELGDDYAPYRLGRAYEAREFGDEEPDYAKILELYELAAERGNVYGMEMAGHYYRLNYVSEDESNAAKAIEYFNRAIARNSNYSRVELALCYEDGLGLEQDYKKAFELYCEAAEQGYTYAGVKMGYYFEDALGVEEDYTKAFECFQKAAEAGSAEGMYNVGRFYKYAVGIPENPELAIEYFQKGADAGDNQAKIELALIYERSYGGVEFDAQKAMDYMTEAAERGYSYAQYKVGYYYYYGLLETDEEKGLEWFRKSYERGYPYAALMLGDYYLYNHGGEAEYEKAFDYYKFAESKNCISEGLGVCYEYGLGVEENETEAFKYYNLSAEQGYTAAKYRLGLCHKYGTGTTENPAEAYNWFSQAVEDEHSRAQYEAAMMLLEGSGVEKDEEKAVQLLMAVAEDDLADAQFELGNCYLTGKGVAEDDVQAMVWFQKAADNGHEQAQKLTGKRERRKR